MSPATAFLMGAILGVLVDGMLIPLWISHVDGEPMPEYREFAE